MNNRLGKQASPITWRYWKTWPFRFCSCLREKENERKMWKGKAWSRLIGWVLTTMKKSEWRSKWKWKWQLKKRNFTWNNIKDWASKNVRSITKTIANSKVVMD